MNLPAETLSLTNVREVRWVRGPGSDRTPVSPVRTEPDGSQKKLGRWVVNERAIVVIANTMIARKMYNWYGDRVERREWCSPLGHRTQPWLSPASDLSQPLRFRATRASTPNLDADCESCVAPDSPNLSISCMQKFVVLPYIVWLKWTEPERSACPVAFFSLGHHSNETWHQQK